MSETSKELEKTIQWLTSLPKVEKKPAKKTKLEIVRELRTHLEEALGRGHSFEELAKGITANGIAIGAATLKAYLQKARVEGGARASRKKKTKNTIKKSAASLAEEVVEDNRQVMIEEKTEQGTKPETATNDETTSEIKLGEMKYEPTSAAFPPELRRGRK